MENHTDELDDFNPFKATPPYVPAGPDEAYDFEDWEIEYDLFEHQDWTGLMKWDVTWSWLSQMDKKW